MSKGIAGLLVVFCVLFAGCGGKDSVPYGILPVDKMSPIMWDIIEADQYAAMLVKDSVAHVDPKLERLRLYQEVFRSHNISREKFQKSYKYYKEHPEINQILYDSLAAQGNRYRTEAYAHPAARPAGTPATPATPTPAKPPALMPHIAPPHTATPLFHPPGGRPPGIPTLRPVIKPVTKPDTSHHKTHLPGHPSSNPPAGTPAA